MDVSFGIDLKEANNCFCNFITYYVSTSMMKYMKIDTHLVCKLLRSVLDTKVKTKAKIKNRYNKVTHRTRDTTWESDENTKNTGELR